LLGDQPEQDEPQLATVEHATPATGTTPAGAIFVTAAPPEGETTPSAKAAATAAATATAMHAVSLVAAAATSFENYHQMSFISSRWV
jgi:hypothetical protein